MKFCDGSVITIMFIFFVSLGIALGFCGTYEDELKNDIDNFDYLDHDFIESHGYESFDPYMS